MKALVKILLEEETPVVTGKNDQAASDRRRERLRKRLSGLSDRNAAYFRIAVAMLIVSYVTAVVMAWLQRANWALVTPPLGVAGLVTWWAVGLWREKAYTDLLLAFAEDFPEEVLEAVLAASRRALESNLAHARGAGRGGGARASRGTVQR